ncbi:hypothetical protein [Varibaculum prostatecancerukia]|uniref:hypothetical protein n=1 Tax=Varibaculum prostatecancerukia TaxID=2811781 RepID=UPI001C00622A|nr:hypothetical protein [Varibaculum prostatecancerukia]
MRRFLDLVVAGVGLFLCLFSALALVAVSAHSEAGLLQILTVFLALIFAAVACAFLLVFAGLRLVFKLAPRRFWGRALLVALIVTLVILIYAFASGSSQAQLLTLALGIFSALTLLQFVCSFAIIPASSQKTTKAKASAARSHKEKPGR